MGQELRGLAAELRLSPAGQRQTALPGLRAASLLALPALLSPVPQSGSWAAAPTSQAARQAGPGSKHTQPGALLWPALTLGLSPGHVCAKEIAVKGTGEGL